MSESGQLAREQLPSSAESPLLAIEGGSSPTASHHSTDATQPGPPGDPGLLPVAAYARADSQGDLSSASSFKDEVTRKWFEVESPPSSGAVTPRRTPSRDSLLPDSFTQHLVAGARRLQSAVAKTMRTERVSFVDLAANPRLAARARAELDPLVFASPGAVDMNGHAQAYIRAPDLERQGAAVGATVADAAEESRVNADLATLLCARLQASKRATERLLGVLQAMTGAEAAYIKVMRAVSHVNLAGDCDGPAMRSALQRFSDLPYVLSEGRAEVQAALVDITRGVQDVVTLVRKEAALIASEASRSHRAVDSARHCLEGAFADHERACKAADAAHAASRHTASSSISPLHSKQHAAGTPLDPWLTEARCVAAQTLLHAAQASERTLLTGGLGRVKVLEGRRADVMRNTIGAFLQCYQAGLVPLNGQVTALQALVHRISANEDLAELSASAAAAQQTVEALAQRQAAALEDIREELLASPEILRQGGMARWVMGQGRWQDCHCVLTRAGFLHCLPDIDEPLPQDTIALGHTAFITGDAPEFQLIEALPARVAVFSRERVLRFKAPSVDECCEWAISLREGIAAAKGS